MLKGAMSKANLIVNDARQHYSIPAADAVERVYISIENLNDYDPLRCTKVYSDDGYLVGEFAEECRTVISIEDIPEHVVHASTSPTLRNCPILSEQTSRESSHAKP